MDPLSITASVVTLVTIASKLAASLVALRNGFRSAPHEIDSISKEVLSLSVVLIRLQRLAENDALTSVELPVEDGLAEVLRSCREILDKIERKVSAISALLTGHSFVRVKQRWSWTSTKKDLRDLCMRLEYYKTAILMLLQLRNLEVGNATLDVSTHTDGRMRELLLEIQALKAQQLNGSNCETGMNGRAAVQGPDSTERHNAEKSLEPVLPSIELSESVSVTEAHGQVQTGEPSKQDAFEPYDRDSGLGPFARRKANNYPGLASFGTENLPTKHSECPTSEWRWKAEKSEGGSRINIVTAQTNFLNSIETHSGIGAWLSTFRES